MKFTIREEKQRDLGCRNRVKFPYKLLNQKDTKSTRSKLNGAQIFTCNYNPERESETLDADGGGIEEPPALITGGTEGKPDKIGLAMVVLSAPLAVATRREARGGRGRGGEGSK